MKANIPYIEKKFEEFNQMCFGGQLPKPPIELSHAKTFLGICIYKKKRGRDGKIIKYDFRLRISTRIDLPEQEVEDTIIHEMIHYYIGVNGLEDSSSHGPVFRQIMNTINERYGRHITISHKVTEEQREQAYDTRPRWHVVAVVTFKDGRTGIKVLPRIAPRIVNYYNKVGSAREVAGIELYMSNDIFFNRFPNSSALNVVYVEKQDIEAHIQGAERMSCDGKNVHLHTQAPA